MTKSMVWIVFLVGLGLVAAAIVFTVKKIKGGSGTVKLPGGIQLSWKGATLSFLVFGAAFIYGAVTWSMRIDERERNEVVGTAQPINAAMTQFPESKASEYAPESLKAAKSAGDEFARAMAATDSRFTLFRSYAAVLPIAERAAKAGDRLVADASAGRERARTNAEQILAEARMTVERAAASLQVAPTGKGTRADIPILEQEFAAAQSGLSQAQSEFASGNYKEAVVMGQAVTARAAGIQSSVEAAKAAVKRHR